MYDTELMKGRVCGLGWPWEKMADGNFKKDRIRKFVYTRWEETGFPKRVNHAVTSYSDDEHRGFMYSLGGFKGKGEVRNGVEVWPELGRVPMDVVELNLGKKVTRL